MPASPAAISAASAATGSGARFRFFVSVLATSVSHKIQVANASDFMIGLIGKDGAVLVQGLVASASDTDRGLIAGLISVVIAASVTTIGTDLQKIFGTIATKLTTAAG